MSGHLKSKPKNRSLGHTSIWLKGCMRRESLRMEDLLKDHFSGKQSPAYLIKTS
ncbi:hypothetical protein PGT21_020859 [Puccinia graminis f. sp. tritici]|uniref:Uncharacterized protein n=1 Tax=Puccinia graminis f. sp. tritici TaxID=56615 RepID=A0A5B0NN67_PUCGR|nr:hypothetical protein PGT21_020859 [Puccinia graminis f. sp. tritici]